MRTFKILGVIVLIGLLVGCRGAVSPPPGELGRLVDKTAPPAFYDADGTTLWKRQMVLVRAESPRPYLTKYDVHWNGTSLFVNGQKVAENRWVDFVLWNGHGIAKIEVFALDSGELLYPLEEDVRSLDASGISVTWGQGDTFGNRYIVFGVKPPQGETALRIVVTSTLGDVTEDTVLISSIRD